MNYFTKEWYELSQKTSEHLLLEEDKQADTFSEEYFQQIYNQKLAEWQHLQEEVASYGMKSKSSKKSNILPEPFDKEKASTEFQKRFYNIQEHVKRILPEEILKEIADIRVYVLNKASRRVIEDVTQFCEDNRKSVDKTVEEYRKYYQEALKTLDRTLTENFNFHDCIIKDIEQTERSLTIFIDNKGGFTDICEIQFTNYEIMKQDQLLQNCWWIYDEIYKANGKYELHVLLQDKNMNLVEFTISAENISFQRNQ